MVRMPSESVVYGSDTDGSDPFWPNISSGESLLGDVAGGGEKHFFQFLNQCKVFMVGPK